MRERTHLKKITINGAEIHYTERGEGEGDPVIFVHGGLGDFRTWGPQMGPFSERYHAVSYSRRAHYPNAWPLGYEEEAAMEVHIADLAVLIEALELAPAHIVANSYGGYISLFVALRHPRLVRTLSLAEPPVQPILRCLPGGEELWEDFMQRAWRPAGIAFARGDLEGGVRLFVEGAVGAEEYSKLPQRVRAEMLKDAPEMAAQTRAPFEVHMPPFTCSDAAQINVPTLLLYGERSPKMYRLINDELARCMPDTEQAIIGEAAHVLHNQNPGEHNRVVLDFLAGRGLG